MTQLELFDLVIKHYEDGLECNKCGITQPLDCFNSITYVSGTVEYKRICKTCSRNQSQLITYLKNTNTYPPDDYVCPICQRDIAEIGRKGQKKLQNWVLDHCHDTETFRGWLCHHCNTGLGAFKDDINRIKNAVEYLQRHEEIT